MLSLREQLTQKTAEAKRIQDSFNEAFIYNKIRIISELQQKAARVAALSTCISDGMLKLNNLTKTIIATQPVIQCDKLFTAVKDSIVKIERISSLNSQISTGQKSIIDSCRIIDACKKTQDDKLIHLKELVTKRNTVEKAKNVIKRAKWVMSESDRVVPITHRVDEFEKKKNDILITIETVNKTVALLSITKEQGSVLKNLNANVTKYTNELRSITGQKAKIIADNHICPTCMRQVSEDMADSLYQQLLSGISSDCDCS